VNINNYPQWEHSTIAEPREHVAPEPMEGFRAKIENQKESGKKAQQEFGLFDLAVFVWGHVMARPAA
jgi:hypothetical protein